MHMLCYCSVPASDAARSGSSAPCSSINAEETRSSSANRSFKATNRPSTSGDKPTCKREEMGQYKKKQIKIKVIPCRMQGDAVHMHTTSCRVDEKRARRWHRVQCAGRLTLAGNKEQKA
eukprot:scaffold222349_cov19-Tisochrysis_lutea.AAC.1